MYAVGDEFAFDFVPEDREAPEFQTREKVFGQSSQKKKCLITWMTRTRVRRFRLTTRYRQMLTRLRPRSRCKGGQDNMEANFSNINRDAVW